MITDGLSSSRLLGRNLRGELAAALEREEWKHAEQAGSHLAEQVDVEDGRAAREANRGEEPLERHMTDADAGGRDREHQREQPERKHRRDGGVSH